MENTKKGKQMKTYTIELVRIYEITTDETDPNFLRIICDDEEKFYRDGNSLPNVFVATNSVSVIDERETDD